MWQFIKENQFVVGALSGSVAAFLLGLVVNYFKREKIWLGHSILSRNIALKGHSSVSILYESREIQRLDSYTVLLRNIGNRAFKNQPIKIECSSGEIVDYGVETPDGANFDADVENGQLVLICDLLNPGESIKLEVTVMDATKPKALKVIARAENLKLKEIGYEVWLKSLTATERVLVQVMRSIGLFGR
jgi:hypothetical protein